LCIIGAILTIPLSRILSSRTMQMVLKKILDEGENKGLLCEHSIEIIDNGIVETTTVGEQKSNWAGIERISETDDYLFIFIGSCTAHVIPKKCTKGDLPSFIEMLREKTPNHSSDPT
jgi:hypothetical protein